jgi:glycine cleavage system transcriptional repressor
MSEQIVLTAIGADRPGLMEEVSEFVLERGGSLADGRMANLQGQFAIMVLIRGTEETIERLRADLESLSSHSKIHTQLTPVAAAGGAVAARLPFRLTARALDQMGLVHELADLLRGLDVNIESMETTLEAAPVTGAPIFSMSLVVGVPAATALPALRAELDRVCEPLNIDWALAAL